MSDLSVFREPGYLAINKARLDHLASLNLPIAGKSVLELGAGIGDLTHFFLDRDCLVVTSDGRPENVEALRKRFPRGDALALIRDERPRGWQRVGIQQIDVEDPPWGLPEPENIVFCYGLLYHTRCYSDVIKTMAEWCQDLLLIETCVGDYLSVVEDKDDPRNGIYGFGNRPSRERLHDELTKHFPYVYLPFTQPDHPDFPLDWENPPTDGRLTRAVFIASRSKLENPLLTTDIPMKQTL